LIQAASYLTLANASKRGANRGEFALQQIRKVGHDHDQGGYDDAKKYDILRHRGTVFVSAQLVEELACS